MLNSQRRRRKRRRVKAVSEVEWCWSAPTPMAPQRKPASPTTPSWTETMTPRLNWKRRRKRGGIWSLWDHDILVYKPETKTAILERRFLKRFGKIGFGFRKRSNRLVSSPFRPMKEKVQSQTRLNKGGQFFFFGVVNWSVQSNPALTDLKGPLIWAVMGGILST